MSARRTEAAGASLLLLATGLYAQTLPVPTLPPERPSVAGPAGTAAGLTAAGETPGVLGETQPQSWEYRLEVGAGWDSNIDFRLPDGPSGMVLSPRGSLARVLRSAQGDLRVEGAGSWLGYPENKSLSRFYGDLRLEGGYRPSQNTTWRGSASYSLGYNDGSLVLSDQGVMLPLVQARTLTAELAVTRRLGTLTSFRVGARAYRTEFADEDSDLLGLVDGQSIRGTTGLERRLGTRDTVGLEYSLEGALSRQAPEVAPDEGRRYYITHYGSTQWSHLFSPRDGLLLEAGASYTPDAATVGLERRESFYGGASYSRQIRRSSTILFARREVAPAFGLGVIRVENRFGLATTIPMGQSWTLRVRATRIVPETPEGAELSYSTPDEAFVARERRLGRLLLVSGEARYRRRSASGTVPEIEGFQAGIFVSLVDPRTIASPRPRR